MPVPTAALASRTSTPARYPTPTILTAIAKGTAAISKHSAGSAIAAAVSATLSAPSLPPRVACPGCRLFG